MSLMNVFESYPRGLLLPPGSSAHGSVQEDFKVHEKKVSTRTFIKINDCAVTRSVGFYLLHDKGLETCSSFKKKFKSVVTFPLMCY